MNPSITKVERNSDQTLTLYFTSCAATSKFEAALAQERVTESAKTISDALDALDAPGCERIKDFYSVGPAQRAAVESFATAMLKTQLTATTRTQVTNEMITRFLSWKLPEDFYPDNAISFDGEKHDTWGGYPNSWPTGTNLLNGDQARSMLEHVVGTQTLAQEPAQREGDHLTHFGYAHGSYMCRCGQCNKTFAGEKRARTCMRCAMKLLDAQAAQSAVQEPVPEANFGNITAQRDTIRSIFMSHGFTIKDGQTDLKQYVYDAAYALLAAHHGPAVQEPVGYVKPEQLNELKYCNGMSIWAESHNIQYDNPEVTAKGLVAIYALPTAQPAVKESAQPAVQDLSDAALRTLWASSAAKRHSWGHGTTPLMENQGNGNRFAESWHEAEYLVFKEGYFVGLKTTPQPAQPKTEGQISEERDILKAALTKVLEASRSYLEPGGMSKDEFICRVLETIDPWPIEGERP